MSTAFVAPRATEANTGRTQQPATNEFPDVVLVGEHAGFHCSGVVIDSRHALTAAHCIPATRIAIGDNLDNAVEFRVADAEVKANDDVALLTFSTDLPVSSHPLRIEHAAPDSALVIVGFGVTDPIRVTGFGAKRARSNTADGWGCTVARSRELGCSTTSELLIPASRETDTCFGDSGGGVFERAGDTWQLIAITSRSTLPKRVLCGEGGVYVLIDAIQPWLAGLRRQQ